MRTKISYMVLSIFVGICLTTRLQAQVTIGSGHKPAKGLLLQIKDTEPIDPKVNNVTATQGGLILPRIDLIETNSLEPFITNATLDEMKAHEGLMVYNTNKCLNGIGNDHGLYAWYGSSWRKMGEDERDIPEIEYVEDIEGNKYRARQFGDAGVWMIENMRATTYASGLTIPLFDGNSATSATTPFYCYPSSSASGWNQAPNIPNAKSYGLLYNWKAATEYPTYTIGAINQAQNNTLNPSGNEVEIIGPSGTAGKKYVQGICPNGWHLPSDRDWNKLEKEIYEKAHLYSHYTTDDFPFDSTNPLWNDAWSYTQPLASPSKISWRGSTTTDGHNKAMMSPCMPGNTSGRTGGKSKPASQGGFNVLLAGDVSSVALDFGSGSFIWSGSHGIKIDAAGGTAVAWDRYFGMSAGAAGDNLNSKVNRFPNGYRWFFSVRCKKND